MTFFLFSFFLVSQRVLIFGNTCRSNFYCLLFPSLTSCHAALLENWKSKFFFLVWLVQLPQMLYISPSLGKMKIQNILFHLSLTDWKTCLCVWALDETKPELSPAAASDELSVNSLLWDQRLWWESCCGSHTTWCAGINKVKEQQRTWSTRTLILLTVGQTSILFNFVFI